VSLYAQQRERSILISPHSVQDAGTLMTTRCKSMGCTTPVTPPNDFCTTCLENTANADETLSERSLSARYPAYYRDVGDMTEVDVFAVHHLFQIQDFSGCLHHASKLLLLSGVLTVGQSTYTNIKEARDSLTRWLHLNDSQRKDTQ